MQRFKSISTRSRRVFCVAMATLVTIGAMAACSLPAAADGLVVANACSDLEDRKAAGTEAAEAAKAALGDHEAKLVLVFDDPGRELAQRKKMLRGVASVFDRSIIYGCASYAPLTQDSNMSKVGVLAIAGDISVAPAMADLADGHEACGTQIGEALKTADLPESTGRLLLLFGKCHVPLNDKLVQGVAGVLGEDLPIVGGATYHGEEYLYYQGKVYQDGNIGLLLSGDFKCSFSMKGDESSKEAAIAAAADTCAEALGENKDNAVMAFAFDCGGRRAFLADSVPDELAAMTKALDGVPMFGFYGAGEIGSKKNGLPACGAGHHVAVCVLLED